MKMEDMNNIDPSIESEKKMLKLMTEMQSKAMEQQNIDNVPEQSITSPVNTKENISLNVKPDDDSTNYWDVDNIPTKYKLYPDGTKLKARALKVLEVKKLTSMTEDNADSIVNDILRKCVRGIDVNEIYIADKMYLLLWLRANSFRDNHYNVEFECELCHNDSTYHFTIENVEIDYISDDYDINEELILNNGDKLTLKLLQIKDEIGISSFYNRYSNIFNNSSDDIDDELLTISFMIKTVNGYEMDPLNKYNYVLDMDPTNFSLLTTKLMDANVGIKPYMNVKCNKCGGESQLGLTFHPDFFLPKYES